MNPAADVRAGALPAPDAARAAEQLAAGLVAAWGSWCPTVSPDCDQVAFLSDRGGTPQVWLQPLPPADGDQQAPTARPIQVSADPVIEVSWSADGEWLACCVATGGGVRTEVWAIRPDGRDARRIAGGDGRHAELGPWTRAGQRVAVTMPAEQAEGGSAAFLADPASGALTPLAAGDLISVLDLSVAEQYVILKDGPRGKQFCVVVDRQADQDHPLLPYPATGSTDRAIIRPAPTDSRRQEVSGTPSEVSGEDPPLVAYLATDAALPRRQLVAVPLGPRGWRGQAGVLAPRDDAELEGLDADDAGRTLLLVWNVAGRSEVELVDAASGERHPVPDLPGTVVSGALISRDGSTALVAVEGPERPRELWALSVADRRWRRVSEVPRLPPGPLVTPTLETFAARDGLPLTGWLYRPPGLSGSGPAMLSLHGGPEAQERPTFNPQHQAVVAAGYTVFAPNIRGSSGFGRSFVHADDVHGRRDAFDDVLASRDLLVDRGLADPARIAVSGRSYGGYLTLAALAFTPGEFAAGVDICGMSDLHTFYRDTEPWIATAAYSKYGHPVRDRTLLRALSPIRFATNISVPLLVVHGELDSNVPLGESHQIVHRLRRLGRAVRYLELAGEGHEFRRADSRRALIRVLLEFLADTL